MKRVEIRACQLGILIASICILITLLPPLEWNTQRLLIFIGAGLMLFFYVVMLRRFGQPKVDKAEGPGSNGRP